MTTERFLSLPPLENGDRLTRHDFEHRYNLMSHLKKAELIEGVVYMGSPVRVTHSRPHAHMMTWLGLYSAMTSGVGSYDNPTVRLDGDNEPQPDGVLRLETNGSSSISEDGYIEGAPELIVEIAASSASYDLHDKLQVYRRNGVQEYIVWRTHSQQIDWFYLENEAYQRLSMNESGILCSQQFPGLWLAVRSLLAGNLAEVLQVLSQGTATPEHQAFVTQIYSDRIV